MNAVLQHTRSAAGVVRTSLRDPLHSNAHGLLLGSVITSVLGLLFWALAARLFPPESLGMATAVIAAMTFLANVATLGLKNGLLRFLPVARGAARGLVVRSYALSALVAAVAAVVFLVGLPLWAVDLDVLLDSPVIAVGFVVATAGWVLFVLQDHVLVALDRTAWVPTANGAYALVKIIALFLVAGGSYWSIFAVYTVPAMVAVAVVTVVVLRAAPRPQGPGRTGAPRIQGLVRFAATDHAATLLLLAVANLLPLVVLARTGAADSAFYYIAFTIANSLYLVTADVGSSFVTRAARDLLRVEQMARRACAHALLLVVPAVALGCLSAPVLLGLLGPEYAVAGTPLLQLLLLSAVPHVIVGLAINLAQVEQQMRRVLGIQAAVAVGTFVAADAGLRRLGLTGAGWAWLGTQTVLALVLLSTQLRFLWRRPRRPSVSAAPSSASVPARPGRAVRPPLRVAVGDAVAVVRARLERISPAVFPPLLAVVLWAVPFVGVGPGDMTDLGILSLLTPLSAVALVVLTIGFGRSLTRSRSDALPALHTVVLIVLLHGTPALLFGTVRYSWSWKHLGIVDFIQRHGGVDVAAASMPIYHNWPGFFGGSAVLTDLAGLPDAQALALWAPLAFNLANLLVLLALFRSLVADRRRVWLAAWFFFVTTWIGQDYFSPQAAAFVLHLAVLTLLIRRYRRPWPTGVVAAPLTGRGPALVVVLLVLALVSSHQITPVVLVITLGALALFRVVPVGGFAVFGLVAAVQWAAVVAESWTIPNVTSIVGSFLDPVGNVGATLDKASDLRGGQVLVSFGGRAVVVIAAVLAAAGVLMAIRERSLDRVGLVLLVSPLTLLALTSFGGETVFRVVLFAAPAMAYFASGAILAVVDRLRWPQLRSPALGTVVVTAAVLPGFLLGYYGKDQQNYFSTAEVAALEWVAENAPPGSLLVVGNTNYPRDFRNYENVTVVNLSTEPDAERRRVLAAPAEVLSDWLTDDRYRAAYVVLTRSQSIANDSTGPLPPGALTQLGERLRASGAFDALVDGPDAVVLVSRPEPGEAP